MATGGNQASFPHVRGLPNPTDENKCFFNAVIQCLAHTPHILSTLMDPDEEFHLPGGKIRVENTNEEIDLPPLSGRLGARGPLTSALAVTLDELQKFDAGYYDAQVLFDLVTNVCPQFAGGEQHDCHEFMRHLLENVKTEDLHRFFDEKKRPTRLTRLSQEERRQYVELVAEHIYSGKMFRGTLVSTLTCQQCNNASSRHEEFLDLSLPTYVDRLEELVATKRNASKAKAKSKSGPGTKRNTEQPVTIVDTDDDTDHNGNDVVIENMPDQPHDDSGIICSDKKDDESPKEATVQVQQASATVVTCHHQLSENFESMNLKEKKYKVKRTPFTSIETCLNNFTECEVMDENNKVGCINCMTNTKATKQYLISAPPEILILHLKRFEFGDHDRIRKISHHVKFPVRLDLTPFRATKIETLYSLYAVVQHTQRSKNSGHYVAFVKVRPNMAANDPRWQMLSKVNKRGLRSRKNSQSHGITNGNVNGTESIDDDGTTQDASSEASTATRTQWYRVSDTDVKTVTEDEVLKVQAYLLFYERI